MPSTRNQMIDFIQRGNIEPEHVDAALAVSGIRPSPKSWRQFLERLSVVLGGLSLAFALMFLVAYNWGSIGRFEKFGLVQLSIVLAIGGYWKLGADTLSAKISLLVGSILIGVLLALYGQTYQTGVDPWQLFFSWALLLLPWALLGRFAALWVVWLLLINLSLVLYHQPIHRGVWFPFELEVDSLWILFIFNSFALLIWELAAGYFRWLSARWPTRLLAVMSGVLITWLVVMAIFDDSDAHSPGVLVWLIWVPVIYFTYRTLQPDLFMLAGMCLSGITIIVSVLLWLTVDGLEEGGFLLIAITLIGLGSGATLWLKGIHRGWQS